MKAPPLQKEWEERKRYLKLAKELDREGCTIYDSGKTFAGLFPQHQDPEWLGMYIKAKDFWDRAAIAKIKGEAIWKDAVYRHYGYYTTIKWRKWHEDNDLTCHIGSDVYV